MSIPHIGLTQPPPKNLDEMVVAMLCCEQTAGQTVYQHGQSVCARMGELLDHLKGTCKPPEDRWRLPSWIDTYKGGIVDSMHPESIWQSYALYHDCGKPYCCRIDEETGRRHFPDHANVSRRIWSCIGGNDVVGHLIANDMEIHTASAQEITDFLSNGWSCQDSITLLVASLAEVHSNAEMFGGITSVSFRSKLTQIDRRGKLICKHWFGGDQSWMITDQPK